MRNLVAAEWMKAWTGRTWWILAVVGVFMSLLTSFGYAGGAGQAIVQGRSSLASVTNDVARSWMMTFLFASLFGAVFTTREYTTGTIYRSVLLSEGRAALFGAKTVVATAVGVLSGMLAAAGAVLSGWAALSTVGLRPAWTGETWLIILGVFCCNVLAAPWGVFLGWIIRNQIGAIAAVMGLTLLVDPGLQQLAPRGAKYLMTIAMSSVYRDAKPDLLPVPLALVVIAGWLAAAGVAAYQVFRTRDVA